MATEDPIPFDEVLRQSENGQLLRDLTEAYYSITHAVMETRKNGALKIAFKFTPTGKGAVEIDAKFDADVPEHARPTTTFFVTAAGGLIRDDPFQPSLPLREAPRDEDRDAMRDVAEPAPFRVVKD